MIGKALLANAVLTPVATGAIVGEDSGAPQLAMTLSAGQYLTTGPLAAGESGDAGGLLQFTAETWFRVVSGYPAATLDILRGPSGTDTNIQWQLRITPTGTVSAAIRTTTGAHTVTTTEALAVGTWYHLAATITAGGLRVYINGVEKASTVVGGTFIPLSVGSDMQVGALGSTTTNSWDEVAFYRVGLDPDRMMAHYQAGSQRGYLRHVSGNRAGAVLDTITSHSPRSIRAGTRTVMGIYMTGQSPLDELRRAVLAESVDAMMFVAKDGTLTFLDANHRASSPYNTVSMTIGDGGGNELPYADLDFDYSDAFLANEWNVTRVGGEAATQTASDATSISRYFKRAQSWSGLPLTSDADCLEIAEEMLAKYKEPMLRGTSITLTTQDAAVAEEVFRRDIGDRIRLLRTPPGGGSRIDQQLFIQKITVEGVNDRRPWTITWGVSLV